MGAQADSKRVANRFERAKHRDWRRIDRSVPVLLRRTSKSRTGEPICSLGPELGPERAMSRRTNRRRRRQIVRRGMKIVLVGTNRLAAVRFVRQSRSSGARPTAPGAADHPGSPAGRAAAAPRTANHPDRFSFPCRLA